MKTNWWSKHWLRTHYGSKKKNIKNNRTNMDNEMNYF